MASASTSFASTKEMTNYARLCRLLVDAGSQALRDTFDRIHPPAGLHGVLARPLEHSTLQSLRKKRILNATQWGKLYPVIPSSVSSASFDITLLILLLRNICGLTPPVTGWDSLPSAADTSVEAYIARIKHYRNNVYGHASQASVDDPTFNTLWQDIGNALVGLGGASYGAAITNLKTCSMDPDIERHYQELLKKWKQDEDNILRDKLDKMEDTIRDDLQEIKGEIGSTGKKLKTLKTPATEDEGPEQGGGTSRTSGAVASDVAGCSGAIQQAHHEQGTCPKQGGVSTSTSESVAGASGGKRTAKHCVAPPDLSIELTKMSELPTKSKPWSDDHLPVDILLLTVEDCEFLACYAYVRNAFKSYCKDLGFVYFGNMGEREEDPLKDALMRYLKGLDEHMGESEQEPLKVALMRCSKGSAGPGGSQTVTKNAVMQLRPKAIYSVGCCGGLDPEGTKLGDVVISSKLTTEAFKTPVGRDIANLIRNAADGWNPPLKSPKAQEVLVHRDGEILSGIDPASTERHRELNPNAIVVETEGKGIFVAAHDLKIEWVIVKGISHFANDSNAPAKSWKSHACVMAASLVSNMLSNPVVFKHWPHYGDMQSVQKESSTSKRKEELPCSVAQDDKHAGDFDLIKNINVIRQLYKSREGWLAPFPWCEEFHFHLNDIFTRLVMVNREKKARGTGTRNVVDMSAIFQPHEECPEPRKVLIEGKPGMGKTTYCNKVAYDWATEKRKAEDCSPDFQLVLFLKCRDIGIESDLWEAIDDQLLPREIQEDEREKFFEFICQNQSNILLVLDGLDELPTCKLPEFSEIIQGRLLPGCHLVVTARHEAGIPVRKVCDTLLEIEGFTEEDAKEFIIKYFKTEENLAKKLLDQLEYDRNLREMVANPLNTALLCLLCEDFQGIPQRRTQLYMEIVQCVLRRYRKKNGLPENIEDLTEVYKGPLKHLGSIALEGLLEDNMYFADKQLGSHKHDLPGFGFLSVQPGSSKRRPCVSYGFLHKSFQELFAAFYICCQLVNEEISPEILVADRRYFRKLKQVLLFTCGWLAAQSEETAVALFKSIANEVSKGELTRNFFFPVVLDCIKECEKEESDFHLELARSFGSCLKVDSVHFNETEYSYDGLDAAEVLADMLKTNTTVTILNLGNNSFGNAGVKALADILKTNTTLTALNLSFNYLCTAGAEALADMLKTNATLTELNLSDNNLGTAGAEVLADMLKTNTTLTNLNLSENHLGTAGAEVLADMLKINTTLTQLNLSDTDFGTAGAEVLADMLKINTTLTELDLSDNNLGTAGAEVLADILKINTTLTELDLSVNNLGTAGAEVFADTLKTNTTLPKLNLCGNHLGTAGAKALADMLKTNTTLTKLNLYGNHLGTAGAEVFADMLKTNTTLTKLNLRGNHLGTAGAKALADMLKTNTTLTKLNLSINDLGTASAEALADVLKTNTTLTKLNLEGNHLGTAGAEVFADMLKTNTTLTELNLTVNHIGTAGSEALADVLKTNTTLTNLGWHLPYSY